MEWTQPTTVRSMTLIKCHLMNYGFRYGIDHGHPVESDENGEVDIGHPMKLFEEVLRKEGQNIVTRGSNAVWLLCSLSSRFDRRPNRWLKVFGRIVIHMVIVLFALGWLRVHHSFALLELLLQRWYSDKVAHLVYDRVHTKFESILSTEEMYMCTRVSTEHDDDDSNTRLQSICIEKCLQKGKTTNRIFTLCLLPQTLRSAMSK